MDWRRKIGGSAFVTFCCAILAVPVAIFAFAALWMILALIAPDWF